jgi:hypothetical protein
MQRAQLQPPGMDAIAGPVDVLAEGTFVGLDQIEPLFSHRASDHADKARMAQERGPRRASYPVQANARVDISRPVPREEMNLNPASSQGVRQRFGEPFRTTVWVVTISDKGDFQSTTIMQPTQAQRSCASVKSLAVSPQQQRVPKLDFPAVG